jgi:hypothetical protein
VTAIAEDFLAAHWAANPVDASFAGAPGFDHLWPRADAAADAAEEAAWRALAARLDAEPGPATPAARADLAIARAEVTARLAIPSRRGNPAWATGEAAFGIIALLLPQSEPLDGAALHARLDAMPGFLADARARLAAAPASWTRRALEEAHAMAGFLERALPSHPAWSAAWSTAAEAAAQALRAHATALATLPEAPIAAGEALCETLLRRLHLLPFGVAAALRDAEQAFVALAEECARLAEAVAPGAGLAEAAARAAAEAPDPAAAREAYAAAHRAAMAGASALVTPAQEYGLDFRWMPPLFAEAAASLYFLAYRSPPALRPGAGSVYWVPSPGADPAAYRRAQNHATIRSTHAIHHGSIGHHTQNARARAAASALARIGGTDAALGLTCLSSGTMVEGWACHAQDLMLEIPGFDASGDRLLQRLAERRNIASVLVDLRLHRGEWSEAEAVRFYVEQGGFPAARAPREVARNGMFPTSRAMYWLGTREIRRLERRRTVPRRAFHDALLACGHMPVTLAGEMLEASGVLAAPLAA